MIKRFGMCFSADFVGNNPLGHIGVKLPVYVRLLELCQKEGWEVYVLTKKTYKGKGVFKGAWKFNESKFERILKSVKIDLVYDRSAGVSFPPDGDGGAISVNRRDFKILCWDKWAAYKKIGKYMPKTFWVGEKKNLENLLLKVKTAWVVLKPFNGLKGIGIFVGPKDKALRFRPPRKYRRYIAQEFVDTSKGIAGITSGLHDLRVAITNGRVVWCHVRVPTKGSYKANVAEGGSLTEIDYQVVPDSVKKIVAEIAKRFYKKYDNPSYSLDFGIGENGTPKIFELNDQIGFPKWEMKNRDVFLKELVKNFKLNL